MKDNVLEIWCKGDETTIVSRHPCCEWRYRLKRGCFWVSGLSYHWLIANGWNLYNKAVLIKEVEK